MSQEVPSAMQLLILETVVVEPVYFQSPAFGAHTLLVTIPKFIVQCQSCHVERELYAASAVTRA